jgi:TRAP-type uncharacterized transport system fused permease subunit
MIQRKQSIFLLVVVINAVVGFMLPILELRSELTHIPLTIIPWQANYNQSTYIYIPFIINIFIILLTLFTIFKYTNRVIQHKLANLLVLLCVFLMGSFFLYPSSEIPANITVNYKLSAFLPIISAIFAYLAAHYIKKDEQLVRSADRIR